ncbi:MAG: amidohydrolase family protein, partial [Bacteroidales bacterium]|nr:amidohydrolase family protein [Bacteroidales bacterium]
ETRWLLELADENSFIKGVVGWLDLCSPMLEQHLKEFASYPKLVGVRHVIHDEPDDDFMLGADFMKGIAQLEAYELCYDLLLFPRHLSRAVKLVRTFPNQHFVLDHLGKPQIKAGKIEPWKSDIARLAGYPNVWCKLSGMVTEADHKQWHYKELLPYMEVVLNAFGPDWIMLGSDWPVCRLAGEYSEVLNVVHEFIKSLKNSDQEKILYRNAVDCYQLKIEN